MYTDDAGSTTTKTDTTVTNDAVPCGTVSGKFMIVKLRYLLGTYSDWSVPKTFMCANIPNAPPVPTTVLNTLDMIVIEWLPPTNDGGTPILGYKVEMKKNSESAYQIIYDAKENPATKRLEVTKYNNAALEVATYDFQVVAYNWVGASTASTTLNVVIGTKTSATGSLVSGDGIGTIKAMVSYEVDINSKDITNAANTAGGDFFFLHVMLECQKTTNFKCVTVANPRQILTNPPNLIPFVDNGDGTYKATYFVPLDGKVTVTVFLMQSGGFYAEYFNNVFMDGTPAITKIEPTINFNWGTGLITTDSSDFISARWYAKIRAPYTEEYAFIMEGDDGFRLYFEG